MATPQVNASLPQADFGRKTLRKISVRLIPLLGICYGVNYMDRVNVGFAALQMNKDLHFTASVYGFGAGVFFLSYAACEVPSNLWSRVLVTVGVIGCLVVFLWLFALIGYYSSARSFGPTPQRGWTVPLPWQNPMECAWGDLASSWTALKWPHCAKKGVPGLRFVTRWLFQRALPSEPFFPCTKTYFS